MQEEYSLIESKMSAKLKQLFPYIMFQNIETSTGVGVPDIIYSHADTQGWIELKELSRRPVNMFTVPWRPGQLAWYTNYTRKYKSASPYLLVLTIQDSWYFITDIKEKYSMVEVVRFYVGDTKDLAHTKDTILHVLFPTN